MIETSGQVRQQAKIFTDEGGLRWLRVKGIMFFVVFLIGSAFTWLAPSFVNSANPNALNCCSNMAAIDFPAKLAYSSELNDPVVFGSGPLHRVVKYQRGSLYDAVDSRRIRATTPEEEEVIGEKNYAIERYGAVEGKYVSITFDDGPDPVYTPQILDILAREHIQATFFVTGKNATKNPEILKRMVREGHVVANHTFTHIDFDKKSSIRDREEIVATDKVIRHLTGHQSTYFRLPYSGSDENSIKQNVRGILQAQQLGFEVASFNLDTNDWKLSQAPASQEIPTLDSKGNIMLFHDAGGNREPTIGYLEGVIKKAKAENYNFYTMPQLRQNPTDVYTPTVPIFSDYLAFAFAEAIFVMPDILMNVLFGIAAINIVLFSLMNVCLALLNKRRLRLKKMKQTGTYKPFVSIIVSAFNEEMVIEKTIKSIFCSTYRKFEVIVINDGSSDNTWLVLKELKKKYKRLTVINQKNHGKATALNTGIQRATGEVLITADADTVFMKDTVSNLAWHFNDKKIGAVAGFIKVGNCRSILTRWQALEYISGISMERFAQSFFGNIMITPGACGAWSKKAVLESGGFSSDTLAEDCDLTLKIQKSGYKSITDLNAIAYTEAPKTVKDLLKQRFRWMYGNLQVFWKQKDMVFNPKFGFLGMFILPQAIFAILVQLIFMPFTYVMLIENFVSGNYQAALWYIVAIIILQFFISLFSIWISKEKLSNLLIVPIYRFIAEPLRAYLLYASVISILKGQLVGWNKVTRTGDVKAVVENERRVRRLPAAAN